MIEPFTEGSLTFLFLVSPRDDSQNRGEMTGSKITYHQQVSYCGKPRCRRCREGVGHGPYWYAYQTVNGRTVRSYVGKQAPPEIVAAAQAQASGLASPEFANPLLRLSVLGQFRLEQRAVDAPISPSNNPTSSGTQRARTRTPPNMDGPFEPGKPITPHQRANHPPRRCTR